MKSALSKKWIWAGALPLIGSFAVCADTTTPTTEFDANLESSAEITPYIVNGSNASVSDFPSIASLFIDSLEYDNFYTTNPYCGATILDQYHVLTAAHCIYGNETAQLFTTVVPQLENVNDYPFGNIQRYRVTEIYYRNDYDNRLSQLLANDVAILKLSDAMNIDTINDVVRRPSSEAYRSTFGAPEFVAIGHGDTVSGFDATTRLQQVDLNLITNSVCRNVFTSGSALTDSQICFNGDFSSITRLRGGTCQGDSGGPVYWKDGSNYVQVGITSFGPSQCGDPNAGATSVFTEIYDYRVWINSVLSGSETPKATSSDLQRTAYLNQHGNIQFASSSSEDGGSLSALWLGVLLALGLRRTHSVRRLQGSRR